MVHPTHIRPPLAISLDPSGFSVEKVYEGPIPRPLVRSVEALAPGARDVRYVYVATGREGVLYVGQTGNPAQRLVAHRKSNAWWYAAKGVAIFRHSFEGWVSVDREIIEIERQAIADLGPIFNRDRSVPERDKAKPWR